MMQNKANYIPVFSNTSWFEAISFSGSAQIDGYLRAEAIGLRKAAEAAGCFLRFPSRNNFLFPHLPTVPQALHAPKALATNAPLPSGLAQPRDSRGL